MTITFYLALVIVMLTVWDSTMGSESGHHSSSESHEHQVRCDQLPKERLDISALFRITSFTMTHAIGSIFNCTKAIYIKPVSPAVNFSLIITQGASVFYYDAKVFEGAKGGELTECFTGMTGNWSSYKARLESDTDGYFCAFVCSSDGLSMIQFNCVSAGNSVNPDITNKVIPYLKRNVPGADAIVDTRDNCPPPKCTFFP